MSVEVDSVIVDLQVKLADYRRDMQEALGLQERYQRGWTGAPANDTGIAQQAASAKRATQDVVQAEEQATAKITRTRKARADAATSAAATEKQAAKDAAAAVKAAEKEKQAAITASERAVARAAAAEAKFQDQQTKRAQVRYYAQGPQMFEAKAREFSASDAAAQAAAAQAQARADKEAAAVIAAAEKEKQAAISATERAMARAQVASERFIASQTKAAEKRFYAMGPEIFEAKAREYAAAGAAPAVKQPFSAEAARQDLLRRAEARPANPNRVIYDANDKRVPEGDFRSALVRPTPAPASVSNYAPSSEIGTLEAGGAAEAKEINSLTADILTKQAALATVRGAEKIQLQDELSLMRLERSLTAQGIAEEEILLRLETQRAAVAAIRTAEAKKQSAANGTKTVEQFARGAGAYAATGGPAAIAGIATAVGAAAVAEGVESSIKFAKAISDTAEQIGISTTQLQVYERAAQDAGVTNDQLRSSFSHLADEIGKAKEGDEKSGKLFKNALDINVNDFKTVGDALPTIIDRLSKIPDAAQRAAIETNLFGEEGRRLDSVLSGGNAKIDSLADSMERAGSILGPNEIKDLKDAEKVLTDIHTQLEVDLANVVAHNKDAILELAKAFGELAEKSLSALNSLARIRNQNLFQGGSEQERGQAFSDLLPDAKGRQFLRSELEKRYVEVDAPRLIVDGKERPEARAQAIQDQKKAIAHQLGQVLFYKPQVDTPPPVKEGNPNPGAINHLLDPKGRKGKSAETLEAERIARDKRYSDELAQLQDQELRARNSIVTDIDKRAEGEDQLAANALKRRLSDIEDERKANVNKGENAGEAEARAKTLSAQAIEAANQERIARATQTKAEHVEADLSITQATLSLSDDTLNAQLALADTAKERLKIETAILANAKKLEQAQIDAVLNNPLSTPAQVSAARLRRDGDAAQGIESLDQRYATRGGNIRRQNETPGQQYARSLRVTPDTIQSSEVKVLQDFNNGLDQSITKALKLHGIFGDIVGDLVDMVVKQGLIAPLANSLFPTGGSGAGVAASGGGIFKSVLGGIGSIFGLGGSSLSGISASNTSIAGLGGLPSSSDLSAIAGLPGFATGGSGRIGGNAGTDQNVLSINSKPVARVGKGEMLSISPNAVNPNAKVASSTQQNVVVVQPIHADFSGARTDEQTMREFQAYADARSSQAYHAAVNTAGGQVAGIVQRNQTLGS